MSCTPSRTPAAQFGCNADVVAQTSDDDVPGGVVQRGDQSTQRRQGVRYRAAVHAAVHGVPQGSDFDHDIGSTTERGGQRRHVDCPVRGVG
jgi:hypothetical protein